jgi:hypothetical protein
MEYPRDGTGTTDKIFSYIPPDVKLEHLYRIFTGLTKRPSKRIIENAKPARRAQGRII